MPFRYLYKMFNYKKIPKLIIFIFFMNSLFNLLSHSSTSIGSSPTLVWNCGIRYFLEEAPGRLFNFIYLLIYWHYEQVVFFIHINFFGKLGQLWGQCEF